MNYYIFSVAWFPKHWCSAWYIDWERNAMLDTSVLWICMGPLQISVGRTFGV